MRHLILVAIIGLIAYKLEQYQNRQTRNETKN